MGLLTRLTLIDFYKCLLLNAAKDPSRQKSVFVINQMAIRVTINPKLCLNACFVMKASKSSKKQAQANRVGNPIAEKANVDMKFVDRKILSELVVT